MQMADLFEKAISNSEYLGEFEYNNLLKYVSEQKYNAIATNNYEDKSIILVFVKGEAEGAAQIDEYGMLYGDTVIYSLDKAGTYKLFLTEKDLADSLAARTRIFDKKYIKSEKFSTDLFDIKSFSTRPAKIKIIVLKNENPVPGLKIIMQKNNAPVAYDFTSSDGSVGFILQGGDYHCNVIETGNKEHTFLIKMEGKETVITIKI
jgi:hypothetical protein